MKSQCLICSVEFEVLVKRENSENLFPNFDKILKTFCTYFTPQNNILTRWNLHLEPPLFCPKCMTIVTQLCTLKEEFDGIEFKISKIVSQVLSTIFQTSGHGSSKYKKIDDIRSLIKSHCNPFVELRNCQNIVQPKKSPGEIIKQELDIDDPVTSQIKEEDFTEKSLDGLEDSLDNFDTGNSPQSEACPSENDDDDDYDPGQDDSLIDLPPTKPKRGRKRKKDVKESSNSSPRKRFRERKTSRPYRSTKPVTKEMEPGRWLYKDKYEFVEEDDEKLKCSTCNRIINTKSQMNLHLRAHLIKDSKQYYCAVCDYVFVTQFEKDRHERGHQKEGKKDENYRVTDSGDNNFLFDKKWPFTQRGEDWECGTCQLVAPARHTLFLHLKQRHINGGKIVQKLGGGKYLYHGKYEFEEVEDGQVKCGVCSKIIKNRDKMVLHLRAHEIKDNKRFPCTICDKSFVGQNELVKHEGRHKEQKESYRTKDCGDGKNFLYDHKHPFTMEGNEFKCGSCENAVYKSRPAIFHHMKMTHIYLAPAETLGGLYEDKWPWEVVKDGFKCLTCGRCRLDKHNLFNHIKQNHISPDKYFCEICAKFFAVKAKFQNHLALHGDTRPFICEVCGDALRSKEELRQHKLSHQSWNCDVCGQKFEGRSGKSNMYHHRKRAHTQKSFYCFVETCQKSFLYQSELTKHLTTHKT